MANINDGQDNLAIAVPITKATDAGDGTVFVEGLCTDDNLDLDSQIIDADFAAKGLEAWFKDWANVRQMHSSNLAPAGKAVSMEKRADGIWVKTHVVEPTAVKLVKEGVYSAYSVGISKPRIIADGIAKNGRVVDGIFSEISLVDFPANPRSKFQLAKRASNGEVEVVEKTIEPEVTKSVPTPRDLFDKGGDLPKPVEKRDIPDSERDKMDDSDFAGPHQSFPIAKPEDVAAAAHLVGKADNPEAVKAAIIRIARRKGPEFVAELPDSWKAVEADVAKAGAKNCPKCGDQHDADFKGKFCPNCGAKLPAAKGEDAELVKADSEKVDNDDDDQDDAKGEATEDGDEDGTDEDEKAEKAETPFFVKQLHDATCAAYREDDVLAQYPAVAKGIPSLIDVPFWGAEVTKAIEAQDPAAITARSEAFALALQLAKSEPELVDEAMDGVRKAFQGYYPDAHPTPVDMSPGKFHRPYLTAGRISMSPSGHPRIPLGAHTPSPSQFTRPASPNGKSAEADLTKGRTYYTNAAREAASGVLTAMHDYIASQHPELCVMDHESIAEEPSTQKMDMREDAKPTSVNLAATPDLTKGSDLYKGIESIATDLVKAAVEPLVEENKTLREANDALAKRVTDLEDAPDPAARAYRGAALGALRPKASEETTAGRGDDAQVQKLTAVILKARHRDSEISRQGMDQLVKLVGPEQAADLVG